MLVTENYNLKEGQLEAIAAAEKPRNSSNLFFKHEKVQEDLAKDVKVIPSPPAAGA